MLESRITVGDSDITDSAGAETSCQRCHGNDDNDRVCERPNQRRKRFRNHNGEQNPVITASHRFRRFDFTLVKLQKAALYQSRKKRYATCHKRYDTGIRAVGFSDQRPCHRQHDNNDNDLRQRTETVDDRPQNRMNDFAGHQPFFARHHKDKAEQNPEYKDKNGRNADHIHCLADSRNDLFPHFRAERMFQHFPKRIFI